MAVKNIDIQNLKQKDMKRHMQRKEPEPLVNVKREVSKYFLYHPLVIWALITLYPFWYMLVLATRGPAEIFRMPPPVWFSKALLSNYEVLLDRLPFWRNLWNSFYIAAMASLLSMFFCSLGGFGFAMYKFKGRNLLFNFMIATLMIPPLLGIVPYFIMMSYFGWVNTPRALYLPGAAGAYGIYLLRQYILSAVPPDLMDAARIDGCTEFAIYYRVVLPIIKPGVGALGLISFIGSWNNFMTALVILKARATYTLPVALRSFQGAAQTHYGAIMVGATIAVFPLLIIFAFMSKQIISGLTLGALKG